MCSDTAAHAAVAELLNSQNRLIQLVSFLAGDCNQIYFNCSKIEFTNYIFNFFQGNSYCFQNPFLGFSGVGFRVRVKKKGFRV